MTTLEEAERLLLEGHSLNVVGLPGSGQSRLLRALHTHLTTEGWNAELRAASELVGMPSKGLRRMLAALGNRSMPVLLVDDYGDILIHSDGERIERQLFASVERQPGAGSEYLRAVVATAPRDREIVTPSSSLRDRMQVIDCLNVPVHEAFSTLGGDPLEWTALTGGNPHLLPATATTSPTRDAVAERSQALASWYVGKLRADTMERLARILRGNPPSQWRAETDGTLLPLVAPAQHDGVTVAVPPSAFDRSAYEALLYTTRWPDRDVGASVARFQARCGNEPNPIWVDNFLSDVANLDFRQLVRFVDEVLLGQGAPPSLRILSRATVNGRTVDPADIADAMKAAGASLPLLARVEWRQYRRSATGNLHDRQLVLPKRGAAVGLPPADIVLGSREVGNESDSELRTAEHQATLAAWRAGHAVAW